VYGSVLKVLFTPIVVVFRPKSDLMAFVFLLYSRSSGSDWKPRTLGQRCHEPPHLPVRFTAPRVSPPSPLPPLLEHFLLQPALPRSLVHAPHRRHPARNFSMAVGPEEGKNGFAAGRGRPIVVEPPPAGGGGVGTGSGDVLRRPRGSSMGGADSKVRCRLKRWDRLGLARLMKASTRNGDWRP